MSQSTLPRADSPHDDRDQPRFEGELVLGGHGRERASGRVPWLLAGGAAVVTTLSAAVATVPLFAREDQLTVFLPLLVWVAAPGIGPAATWAGEVARSWRSAFGGFAPGFFYLVEGDPRLEVPRRSEPRTAVPDGAVALAGTFSAVYPRTSPGGWQLIGHTDLQIFSIDRDPPALLRPGVRVRFREIG